MPHALPPPTPRTGRRPRRAALGAVLGAAVLLLVGGCDGGGTDEAEFSDDLVGRFEARDRYVPLAEALASAGLAPALRTGGPYTVLAPTRIAFDYVGDDLSPVIFADAQREVLARLLRHHVVPGLLGPDDFADGATLTAIDGTVLHVRRFGPVVTVDGVTLDLDDPTEASNGIAYPLADVLLDVLTGPERVRLSPLLATFAAGTRNTGVLAEAEALDRVTVLAPTNDAFSALGAGAGVLFSAVNTAVLTRALRSHVLPGDVDLTALAGQSVTTLGGDRLEVRLANGVLTVDGIRVIREEATADGRLYVLVDPVLSTLSLAERLRILPTLSRFTSDAGITPIVQGPLEDRAASVTVFAPVDFVYAARSAALAEALAEPDQAALVRRITASQVVQGRYTRADLVDGLVLTTLDGLTLRVERTGDTIRIDGRELRGEPLRAANGLLYASEFFILPSVDLLDTVLLSNYVGFFRAVKRAGLETAYRTTVRTAFVVPDGLADRGFIDRTDLALVLRRTATTASIPALADLALPSPFTALDGTARTVVPFDCSLTPVDSGCSPFVLARAGEKTGTQVYQGSSTRDRSAVFHILRGIDEPPTLRAGPPQAGR